MSSRLIQGWGNDNVFWAVFRRDRTTHRLVRDTVFAHIADPEPLKAAGVRCVGDFYNGGGGREYSTSVYCWDGDRLRELFRVQEDWNDSTRRYVRRTYTRMDGSDSLVLVRTVSFPRVK